MSYIENFKGFKLMLESNNITYIQHIYENFGVDATVAAAPGGEVTDMKKTDPFDQETQPNLSNASVDKFGPTSLPQLKIASNPISVAIGGGDMSTCLQYFINGAGRASNNMEAIDSDDKVEKLVNDLNITVEKSGTIQCIKDGYHIQSVGDINNRNIKNPGKDDRNSVYDRIAAYLNGFNMQNWAAGDFTQYDPNKILNDKKRVDLTSTSKAIIKESGFLYLMTPQSFDQTAGEREDTEQIIQGAAAQEGAVANAFQPMKYQSTPESAWVQDIGEKIKGYLGDKGVIKQITLTSSASPDWAGKATGVSNGTGDPSGGKLNGTTFSKEPSELGNQYLAYLRGLSFKNALIQYLGNAYPQAANTIINWKVSKDEPGGGRHFKYNVETRAESPTTITVTEYQKGESEKKEISGAYFIYKVKFDASALGTDNAGFLGLGKSKVSYSGLKVGDKIKFYGKSKDGTLSKKPMGKDGQYEISKIENNKVYINANGEDKPISSDRYIGLAQKREKDSGDMI